MSIFESDIKPDIEIADRNETIGTMEPMLIGESSNKRAGITDPAVELAAKSAGFRRSLPPQIAASVDLGQGYRLIAAFNFNAQICFVKFIGTHAEYDKIDASTVSQF
jgi:hypothetical protein